MSEIRAPILALWYVDKVVRYQTIMACQLMADFCEAIMWIIDPNAGDGREWLPVLGGELKIAVEFDQSEAGYQDNIKLVFSENTQPEFALFRANESSFGLTSEEARKLAKWLIDAADQNDQWLQKSKDF